MCSSSALNFPSALSKRRETNDGSVAPWAICCFANLNGLSASLKKSFRHSAAYRLNFAPGNQAGKYLTAACQVKFESQSPGLLTSRYNVNKPGSCNGGGGDLLENLFRLIDH